VASLFEKKASQTSEVSSFQPVSDTADEFDLSSG
jgi:hypothetical protein